MPSVDFDRLDAVAERLKAEFPPRDGPDAPAKEPQRGQTAPDTPTALPSELEPVEALPLAAMPDAFRPWVADVAERMQCPPDFVGVPMLVAAASLAARCVAIRPQDQTDWSERGNLWALLVGRPGLMKSPSMAQALAPIERLEAQAATAYAETLRAHQGEELARKLRDDLRQREAKSRLKDDLSADVSHLLTPQPDAAAPARPRYIVQNATYEKLGVILADNPGGVLSVRDEMRGLFLHLAREENSEARGFYLQAWSGGRYVFDRITRDMTAIPDVRLSMIGTIQPGPLSHLLQQARQGAGDDGLLERFLVAWPDAEGDWREVDRWPDSQARRSAWGVFERLDALTPQAAGAEQDRHPDGTERGMPYLRFAPDAREVFADWRAELERKIRSSDSEGLEGALAKFRHHVPALALVLHLIDDSGGPVSMRATLRAVALAEYFESHARRVFGSGRRLVVRAARLVVQKAREGKLPDPFTLRDVYRQQWAGLGERQVVADALDMLAAHGWLTEATAETGGRPTTIFSLTEGARRG